MLERRNLTAEITQMRRESRRSFEKHKSLQTITGIVEVSKIEMSVAKRAAYSSFRVASKE
jgi:hypothetical protein